MIFSRAQKCYETWYRPIIIQTEINFISVLNFRLKYTISIASMVSTQVITNIAWLKQKKITQKK